LAPEQAAALSAAFLRDVTDNVVAASRKAPILGLVAYAPAGSVSLFDGSVAEGTGFVLADGVSASPGDMPADVAGFGRCLLHAVRAMLSQGFGAACVLNSDSPTLPTQCLADAAHALLAAGDRVVLGPAEDGGYYLLGVKRPHARLFADIAWSTDSVANATRARAQELGLDIVELPVWYDVDDRASLARLLREICGQPPPEPLSPRPVNPGPLNPGYLGTCPSTPSHSNPGRPDPGPFVPTPARATEAALRQIGLVTPEQLLAAE
jgi:hypothetical protein